MNVNFNGYGEAVVTFEADSTVTETGIPVKISGDGTVGACDSGDNFCGVCIGLRSDYAVVQLSGYVTLTAASKIEPGYQSLSAGADGTVQVSASGREYLVTDSTETTVGFIL